VNKGFRIICCFGFAAAIMISGRVLAEDDASAAKEVTVITSEKLTFDYMKQFALFETNVVVIDPRLKIYADKMKVTFSKENKAERVVASGNVIMIQEDKRARATTAEYNIATGEITLTGDPMITSGANIMTAETIKFWRDENRMEAMPRPRLLLSSELGSEKDRLFMEPVRDR